MALDNTNLLSSSTLSPSSDKVLIYRNGGSEASTSLLNLTNSALSVAGVYVDTVNQRVGIGTSAPTRALEVRGSVLIQDVSGTDGSIQVGSNLGGIVLYSANRSEIQLATNAKMTTRGTGITFRSTSGEPNGAILGVVGSGSTSATTSLLVHNSAGTEAFRVRDDLATIFSGNSYFNGYSQTFSGGITFVDSGQFYRNGAISMQCVSGVGNNNSVVINENPNTSLASCAILIATSTSKGFLPPRMTTAQKNAIASPAAGLMVYDTDLNRPCFYSGSAWVTL